MVGIGKKPIAVHLERFVSRMVLQADWHIRETFFPRRNRRESAPDTNAPVKKSRCTVLPRLPEHYPVVRRRLRDFELVQLDPWDRTTPVLRPDGRRSTPAEWAAELGTFYTPTLVFFDPGGKEIFRIDSVVQFFRLAGALRYVTETAYLRQPVFQYWKYRVNPEEQALFKDRPRGR